MSIRPETQAFKDAIGRMRKSTADPRPIWTPQRGSQYAYHASPAFELLYGGAAGGGKSESLIMESILLCDTHPNYRAILFRRTYPEIEKSLVPRVSELLYGGARSRDSGMEWHFPNGSVLYLSHMQRLEDKERHKSVEYDWIGFDELTSFLEEQYTYLFTRCRGSTPVPRFVRAGTNPTGIGHGWVKKRFVEFDMGPDNKPVDVENSGLVSYEFAYGWKYRGRVYTNFTDLPPGYAQGEPVFSDKDYVVWKEKKSGLTRSFIPSLLWGNSSLLKNDPEYVNRMRSQDMKTQEALLYGHWDLFEGQFFSEWNPDIHCVEPFEIPTSWRRYVAIDYGYASPMCALWFAIDEDGTIHVYRELYGKGMTTFDQASKILAMSEDEKIEWYCSDPALFQKSGSGESHGQIYDRAGVSLIPSSNKRAPGWALLHQVLKDGKLKVFRSCVNTIRTLPTLMHSKYNVEDLDTAQEDHAADTLRYFLLTWRGYCSPIDADKSGESPEWFTEAMKKNNPNYRKSRMMRVRI